MVNGQPSSESAEGQGLPVCRCSEGTTSHALTGVWMRRQGLQPRSLQQTMQCKPWKGHEKAWNVQVPTLVGPEGAVWESNAIARYLARKADKGLFGKTAIDMVSASLLACV